MNVVNCRFCGSELSQNFVDLGMSPLSNSYLNSEQIKQKELFFPLHVFVCKNFSCSLPLSNLSEIEKEL